MATKIKDRTALIPWVLFGILASIVVYVEIKEARRKKAVQMKEDVLYIAPKTSL